MPPRDLPPLVSSPSCRSARSGSAESIHVDSAADRYGLNRPKDLIGRSDGRVQRKILMIGAISITVAADRFCVRPGGAWESRRVTGHEFAMADIQTPLPLEVRSRSRGHLLSKSDLWTPCVVDVVIRYRLVFHVWRRSHIMEGTEAEHGCNQYSRGGVHRCLRSCKGSSVPHSTWTRPGRTATGLLRATA